MSSPRSFAKVIIGGVALYLFQRFEENIAKQLTFAVYIVVLFVETWFTDSAKELKPGPKRASRPAASITSTRGQTSSAAMHGPAICSSSTARLVPTPSTP